MNHHPDHDQKLEESLPHKKNGQLADAGLGETRSFQEEGNRKNRARASSAAHASSSMTQGPIDALRLPLFEWSACDEFGARLTSAIIMGECVRNASGSAACLRGEPLTGTELSASREA